MALQVQNRSLKHHSFYMAGMPTTMTSIVQHNFLLGRHPWYNGSPGLLANRSSDQSCTRGTIHNKFIAFAQVVPGPVQNRGLKHHSFIHSFLTYSDALQLSCVTLHSIEVCDINCRSIITLWQSLSPECSVVCLLVLKRALGNQFLVLACLVPFLSRFLMSVK